MIPTGRRIRSQIEAEQMARQEEQAKREREKELNSKIERIQSEKESLRQKIANYSNQVDAKKEELEEVNSEFEKIDSKRKRITAEFDNLKKERDEVQDDLKKLSEEEGKIKEELRRINGTNAIPKTVRRIRTQLADDDSYLETPMQRVPHTIIINPIPENSVVNLLEIGDTVIYNNANWNVFEKCEETVYIIPTSPLGRLRLGGENSVSGYQKSVRDYITAIEQIESECKKHTNAELGITSDDIRSLTVEDINRVANYTPTDTPERYAFYLEGATLPTSEQVYNGNIYTQITHNCILHSDINFPRFYTYDYTVHTAVDEQGYTYAYPEGNDPVFVTNTYCKFYIEAHHHKDNCKVKLGSLFGNNDGLLASTCVNCDLNPGVDFCVYQVGTLGISLYYLFCYNGAPYDVASRGVIPLVSLNSTLKAEKQDGVWILSK